MSQWYEHLRAAFGGLSRPPATRGLEQFPELQAALVKEPADLTPDDVWVLIWKLRLLDAIDLFRFYVPELVSRYVRERLGVRKPFLYLALLHWQNEWTESEYDALTAALLAHWVAAVGRHTPPDQEGVFPEEAAFLLLWLRDTRVVEPVLSAIVQEVDRQEREQDWQALWLTWASEVSAIRADPMRALFRCATDGIMEPPDGFQHEQRIREALQRIGLA